MPNGTGAQLLSAACDAHNARQKKLQEELYKVFNTLHVHIRQTNCEHCKAVLRGEEVN